MKSLSLIAIALAFSVNAQADFTSKDAPKAAPSATAVCANKTVTINKYRTDAGVEIELILKDFSVGGKLISGSSKDSCRLETDFGGGISAGKVTVCDIETDTGSISLEQKINNMGVGTLVNLTTGDRHFCE